MPVTAGMDAPARGRLSALDARVLRMKLARVRRFEAKSKKLQRLLIRAGAPYRTVMLLQPKGRARKLMVRLGRHRDSYDSVNRAQEVFSMPERLEPWNDFNDDDFYDLTGFYKEDFLPLCEQLTLMPRVVKRAGSVCEMKRGIFLVLVRWRESGNFKKVAHTMCKGRSWCITMYKAVVLELSKHYRIILKCIDFRRVKPVLDDWEDTLMRTTGTSPGVLFATDGKATKTCCPGSGNFARNLARRLGCSANLMQRAFFNGHYAMHGIKLNMLLQADGMSLTYSLPLRNHDGRAFLSSGIGTQLAILNINDDYARPVRCCSDAAYRETANMSPRRTPAQLNAMTAAARASAHATDSGNSAFRNATELNFASVFNKWRQANMAKAKRVFATGSANAKSSNLHFLYRELDMQFFMWNCFVCMRGSQASSVTGVSPPSIAEYLHSANNGQMVSPAGVLVQ